MGFVYLWSILQAANKGNTDRYDNICFIKFRKVDRQSYMSFGNTTDKIDQEWTNTGNVTPLPCI